MTIYRFDPFEIDLGRGELRRDGDRVALTGKAFACVRHLVEHRERAVDRDELMRAVWGHVHRGEGSIAQAMLQARQALGDNGRQRIIRTVRGVGYRWIASVEVDPPRASAAVAGVAIDTTSMQRAPPNRIFRLERWTVVAIAALLACAAAWTWFRASPRSTLPPAELVALLPVRAGDDPDDAWIRLGTLDVVTRRLRAAGQAVVPIETTIALLAGTDAPYDAPTKAAIQRTTRASRLLEGTAERADGGWTFTLRDAAPDGRALQARAQARDVIDAAREASDAFALLLGGFPPTDAGESRDVAQLVARVNAALMAQHVDAARQLLATAPESLRTGSEVRLQAGRLAFYAQDLDAAQTAFDGLLADASTRSDPILRARALNGAAAVFALRGDGARAEPLMVEAAGLIEDQGPQRAPDTLGTIWMNLGNVAQERGDLDLARTRMARARQVFEGNGDVRHLAELDMNLGVIEARREHCFEALRLFRAASRHFRDAHDIGGEAMSMADQLDARLCLLDVADDDTERSRLAELALRAGNADIVAHADVTLADWEAALGHADAARGFLLDAQRVVDRHADIPIARRDVLLRQAEDALARGDPSNAAYRARLAVADASPDDDSAIADRLHAALVCLRAAIAAGDRAGTARESAALDALAVPAHSPSLLAWKTLGVAERAAADGDAASAREGYEQALAQADASQVPLRVREVLDRYSSWLLAQPLPDRSDLERIFDRATEHAHGDAIAARIRLEMSRALQAKTTLHAWEGERAPADADH